MGETLDLPLFLIDSPPILFRPVDRECVEYLELRDSIAESGLHNSILVRRSETNRGRYEVVDGNWRVHCCRDLEMETIPAIVKEATDWDVMVFQIQAQAIRPHTRPVDFARQMKRMLSLQPEMTASDLSVVLKKSPKWVYDQLNLLELTEDEQRMVDRGEIPLKSAYMLAKFPRFLRREEIGMAKQMGAREFEQYAAPKLKAYKEACRKGSLDTYYAEEFQPQPHLRSLRKILRELENPLEGIAVLASEGCRGEREAFYAALKWVVHLDTLSIAKAKKKHHDLQRNKELGEEE